MIIILLFFFINCFTISSQKVLIFGLIFKTSKTISPLLRENKLNSTTALNTSWDYVRDPSVFNCRHQNKETKNKDRHPLPCSKATLPVHDHTCLTTNTTKQETRFKKMKEKRTEFCVCAQRTHRNFLQNSDNKRYCMQNPYKIEKKHHLSVINSRALVINLGIFHSFSERKISS